MVYLFDVPAYFILLRETLEVTIILAVLLGFIDKFVPEKNPALRKYLKRQIWIGTGLGLAISLVVGIAFIVIFYTVAKNLWDENSAAWEGSFALIASVVITLMTLSMTRVQRWKGKWEKKLEETTENQLNKHKTGGRWALILLPLSVVCRESVETLIFIGGIGFDKPATDLPIPAILGLFTGFFAGWILYKGSHKVSIHAFFTVTTVFLLFIAAGLFSTAIGEFQEATKTEGVIIWEAPCCNEDTNEFWGIMKSLFGWRSEATVGTTIGYFVYWIFVIIAILLMKYYDKKKATKELKEKNLRGEVFDDKSVAEAIDNTDADVIDKTDADVV